MNGGERYMKGVSHCIFRDQGMFEVKARNPLNFRNCRQ